MLYSGKKFSLLGDSVSTFQGYTVLSGVFYGRAVCRKAGLTGVSDTWWMRVIQALGGTLEVNNSYSGSCVSPVGLGSAASRTGSLGHPDVILVFMGANDAGFGVPPADFEAAYDRMLFCMKEHNPRAEIWCATLASGRKVLPDEPSFWSSAPSPAAYNAAIRRSCGRAGCRLADIAADGLVYDAIDGVHPTRDGMQAIADAFVRSLRAD